MGGVFSTIAAYAAAGFRTFPLRNKRPLKGFHWKDRADLHFFADSSTFQNQEFAVIVGDATLVIDVDPRNFIEGKNPWTEIKELLGLTAEDLNTFTVNSPRGGSHFYFRKPTDFPCAKHLKQYPGIDFLSGQGSYVVGARSKVFGKDYVIANGDLENIKQAPTTLLNMLQRADIISPFEIDETVEYHDTPANITRYAQWAAVCEPAVQGSNGDHRTYTVACQGRDFGLSHQATFETLAAHWNPRCSPPWDLDDLDNKVRNAYTYATKPQGAQCVEKLLPELSPEEEQKTKDTDFGWDLTSKGVAKPTMRNIVNYMAMHEKELASQIKWNDFSQNIEIFNVPWIKSRPLHNMLTDRDLLELKFWLAQHYNLDPTVTTVLEAVLKTANKNQYNPVQEYIKSITWDKRPRVGEWLTTYCGVDKTEYSKRVGVMTLVAAVTRAFIPGVKYDHVLILEGKQRIGKSTVPAILGGDWFKDIKLSLEYKETDTVQQIQKAWIVELAEMTALKNNVDELKAFITRRVDIARFAYAKTDNPYPRKCIFIGTFNPEKDGAGYLKDTTGNLRFLPVLCKAIDIPGLTRDRDQLWAEAYSMFLKQDAIHLDMAFMQNHAEPEVTARQVGDIWKDVITEYLANGNIRDTTITQVLTEALGVQIRNATRFDQMRVSEVLTALGYEKEQVMKNKIRQYVYRKTDT